MPVAGPGSAALLWTGQLLIGRSTNGPPEDQHPRGVRLETSFDVVRSAPDESINAERLVITPTTGEPQIAAANSGGTLAVSNFIAGHKIFDDDFSERLFTEIVQYAPAATPLAAASPWTVRVPYDLMEFGSNATMGIVRQIVPLANGFLLVGGEGRTVTSVVWKRP